MTDPSQSARRRIRANSLPVKIGGILPVSGIPVAGLMGWTNVRTRPRAQTGPGIRPGAGPTGRTSAPAAAAAAEVLDGGWDEF